MANATWRSLNIHHLRQRPDECAKRLNNGFCCDHRTDWEKRAELLKKVYAGFVANGECHVEVS